MKSLAVRGLIQNYSDMKFHRLRIQTHNQLNLNSLTMMTPYFDVLTSMNWPLLHITTTQRILEASLTCHYVTLNIPSSLLVNWLPHSVLSWHQTQNLMLTYIGNISFQKCISPSKTFQSPEKQRWSGELTRTKHPSWEKASSSLPYQKANLEYH